MIVDHRLIAKFRGRFEMMLQPKNLQFDVFGIHHDEFAKRVFCDVSLMQALTL